MEKIFINVFSIKLIMVIAEIMVNLEENIPKNALNFSVFIFNDIQNLQTFFSNFGLIGARILLVVLPAFLTMLSNQI